MAPPSQPGTLSASLVGGGLVGGGKCVEVLGRDEQLPAAQATALGGHGRPGRVGGLALAVGVVRRLRPGLVRRGLGDRVPPVRDDAGRLDPLVGRPSTASAACSSIRNCPSSRITLHHSGIPRGGTGEVAAYRRLRVTAAGGPTGAGPPRR